MPESDLPICVAALYKFTPFAHLASLREDLRDECEQLGIKGTLLLAQEGINGTIAGTDEAIATIISVIRQLPGCADLEVKYSRAPELPFKRMKVRLKREIVTMGQPDIDPLVNVGHYVNAQDWNALIGRDDTIVIDTRNDYEVAIGKFSGAIDPETASFRDFPAWFRSERERLMGQGTAPKVAMYCTGGIRCEKSTAFLKSEGIEEVFHLKGGILKYLEDIPQEESLWEGECFVFDERVSVGHGLKPGNYRSCKQCGRAVSADQISNNESCPACSSEPSQTD